MRQNRRRMRRKIEYRPAKKGLEKKSSWGREVWIMTHMDGMPFIWASCNAVTCGSETCSQRPCVSSETSETDTLHSSQKCQQQGGTTPDFFLFYSFFFSPNSSYYTTHATWRVTCHQSIHRGPWQCDIICMSDDCAWLCCYFMSSLLLSSFHALLPFSHSEFAWRDRF